MSELVIWDFSHFHIAPKRMSNWRCLVAEINETLSVQNSNMAELCQDTYMYKWFVESVTVQYAQNIRGQGLRARQASVMERGSDVPVMLCLPLCLQWPGSWVFFLHLSSATWFRQTPPLHYWSLSGKAGWVFLQLLPLPSLIVLYWPALFAAQGHEEDILPILQSLSLIEMGSKTRLQKKSLLWTALL